MQGRMPAWPGNRAGGADPGAGARVRSAKAASVPGSGAWIRRKSRQYSPLWKLCSINWLLQGLPSVGSARWRAPGLRLRSSVGAACGRESSARWNGSWTTSALPCQPSGDQAGGPDDAGSTQPIDGRKERIDLLSPLDGFAQQRPDPSRCWRCSAANAVFYRGSALRAARCKRAFSASAARPASSGPKISRRAFSATTSSRSSRPPSLPRAQMRLARSAERWRQAEKGFRSWVHSVQRPALQSRRPGCPGSRAGGGARAGRVASSVVPWRRPRGSRPTIRSSSAPLPRKP